MRKWFSHALMLAAGLAFFGNSAAIAADWSEQDVLDGQCLALYAAELGAVPAGDGDLGVMILVGYFVGKIEGRNPDFDLVALLSPEFMLDVDRSVDAVGTRCAAERLKFVEDLSSAADALVNSKSIDVGNK